MAYSKEQREKLAAGPPPETQRVRDELQDYLNRTGLTVADFAHRINYSRVAVNHFMQGYYARVSGDDRMIRRAIVEYIAAHPIYAPGSMEGQLYETKNVQLLRRYFNEALDRGRAYYVEGDPGTQKSYALQHLVAELNRVEMSKNGHGRRAFYVYCPAQVGRLPLMKIIAQAAGSSSQGDVYRIIRNLQFDFRSRRVLLVLDEAQHLDISCLETIRELHDRPPYFGLLIAGSHQLQRMFDRKALELEQWNSRFSAGRRLPGISEGEAADIVRRELGQISQAKVERIVKKCYADAIGSEGRHSYISARRLFNIVRELQEAAPDRAQAVTA